jgi:FKBP-type peptidyl-prolyl cis-trans isomerase
MYYYFNIPHMKNQKGNIGVIVTFIIVALVVGLVIFILMNRNKEIDESLLQKEIPVNQTDNQLEIPSPESTSALNTLKEEPITQKKQMETNSRILSNFTPVSKISKLEKIDQVAGSGEEVKEGATVSVHYTGAVASTGVIFQSSKDFGTNPVTFPLSGVIKGWTDGIPGMKVGGTRRLLIPADQAYGANPPGGSGIPANADLVFDVELVSISK